MSNNGKNKQNTVFNLYLEAVSVWNNKKQNNGSVASDGITFNTNDYFLIKVSPTKYIYPWINFKTIFIIIENSFGT